MKKIKISTLVCAHCPSEHHNKLFQKALSSIYTQTRQSDELIVVLDECLSSTSTILDNIGFKIPLIVISRDKKMGLANAKNVGLTKCSGDYVAYLDADDEWLDCKLEIQEKATLLRNVDFCFTQAWDNYNGTLKPNCFHTGQYQYSNEIKHRLSNENVLCHGSALIRKKCIDELGGYKDIRGAEDWDLWKRAAIAGYSFYNVPERLYIYSMGTSVER